MSLRVFVKQMLNKKQSMT